ncbi:restriction endonuclease subunit S [Pseudomonas sp. B35(2017)]|uniref:restriction endonuclease subunit S n=1 Tax=Pseudomonas sp. B35(2017) TaxID=1981722 RepID=UPI00148312E9|nr:restriction endonuclease subunit S [Pseudomonas sp. B35(2017)]
MSAVLTDNLSLVAGAPNGIKKLRELILELAVRGKLVPQDPSDGPASELLKQITEEKARLVAQGKIKKQKPQPEITDEEKPFQLPTGWEWVRLDSLLKKIGAGSTPLGGKQAYVANGVKFLRSQNVWSEGLRLNEVAFIPEETHQKMSGTHVEAGDLLFNITGASIGRCAAVPADFDTGNVSQHVTIIRPVSAATQPFLHTALISQLVQQTVMDVQVGVSREGLSIGKLAQFLIPFPPEVEQHRIVSKVGELMALCDRLEARQTDADSAHAQLVQALLSSLTQASDAEGFAQSWQRLAEHFHTLFTTESSIDALEQAFLCLAADGRLVRSYIPADYLALSDVLEGDSLNGSSKKPQDSPGAVEILRISAGTGVAGYVTDELEHKWADVSEAEIQKFLLARDDLLACRFNGNLHYVGAFSLYCGSRGVPQIFPDKLIRFRADRNKASPHYLKYILNAAPARAQIESFCATTVGNIGISAKNLKTIKLRLPTLNEQSNIVSRLDQLMALCDQLKARLNQARQVHEHLASALVEQAVA